MATGRDFARKLLGLPPLPEPAYDSTMLGQVFSWEEIKSRTRFTAEGAAEVARHEGIVLEKLRWQYTRLPISLLDQDGWVSTLAKYAAVSPAHVADMVRAGRFPAQDIATLTRPGLPPEVLAQRLARDVARMQDIMTELRQTGQYYPPILDSNLDSLDGAHRLAALYSMYGPELQVYVWKAEP